MAKPKMIKLNPLSAFCRRMGIGLRAGVDILKILETETKAGNANHRQTMQRVSDSIRGGSSLASAMLDEKRYFPPLLIQMVHASELGGRMESMFGYMADYYDQLKRTRSYFIGQITWPLIQLGMAIAVIGLVILVQGMFASTSTYDASGVGLRGVKGFYIYSGVVTGVLSTILLTSYALWKNWFGCHKILVPIVQRIPMLGTALITLGLSRLSMTLSMLLNAGVEAKRSTKQAFLATGNYYFIGGMDRAVEAIHCGSSFGDAFEKSAVLPADFVESIRIGELSGTETESLDHLATQYQERAKFALTAIATIASFTIWLGIILLLGFMIIRMAMNYINLLNGFLP